MLIEPIKLGQTYILRNGNKSTAIKEDKEDNTFFFSDDFWRNADGSVFGEDASHPYDAVKIYKAELQINTANTAVVTTVTNPLLNKDIIAMYNEYLALEREGNSEAIAAFMLLELKAK